MNAKKLVTLLLLAFVVVSIGAIVAKERGASAPPVAVAPEISGEGAVVPVAEQMAPLADGQKQQEVADPVKVVVYYFHGNFRCWKCKKIEALTTEAVNSGFAQEIEKGRVALNVINMDDPGNAHYVRDYQLVTRSVVLARFEGDTQKDWKRLDNVWGLLDNDAALVKFVQDETSAMLKGNP
ncbi:MAG: nitrophenyl compound nitroreductase subunit ArsF family protein [Alphaproteobacteria bacterium]|nr:nitrophenyl compound nitroreductase subunit ArsF family protein [Alphaproteobacteria bacterium]